MDTAPATSGTNATITNDEEAEEAERAVQEYRMKQASAAAVERAKQVQPLNDLRTSAAYKEVMTKIEELVPLFVTDAAIWPHLNALRTGLVGVATASL